jgi:structural maintenance of chromosome 4
LCLLACIYPCAHYAVFVTIVVDQELENFKSYAGVQEIGIFHKCFSSVVGPNGSGKSNVIDAMLFVFGKRAKQLRLHKVSELIHNSSAVANDPPGFARVSVYFEEIIDTGSGDDDFVVVPNSEIIVTRIAYRNNTSIYKMHNRNCQFKEVASFLGKKGIDLDNNRFLILQGEVELISMMPPKGKNEGDDGLLEYLEDIIGSNQFVEETNAVAARVEALGEIRQERINRVKAVQKEKENLEPAKREAQMLLQKERDIRRKQNILYQVYSYGIRKDIAKLEQSAATVTEQLDVERERISASSQRVEEIEAELVNKRSLYDKVYAELNETKDKFTAYERRDIKLREDIKCLKNEEKKINRKLQTEQQRQQDAEEKIEAAEEEIPVLEGELESLAETRSKEAAALEAIHDDIKETTSSLREQLESKKQEQAPVQQELAEYKATLETAQLQVKMLTEPTEQAKERLGKAQHELEQLEEDEKAKRNKLQACMDEFKEIEQRLKSIEKEDSSLSREEDQLAEKNTTLLVSEVSVLTRL